MEKPTFHREGKKITVFSHGKEVGLGMAEEEEGIPYFTRFYLTPWAYACIWKHTPFDQLFPWAVVYQVFDKYSPFLHLLICAEAPFDDPQKWLEFIRARLDSIKSKYRLTDEI